MPDTPRHVPASAPEAEFVARVGPREWREAVESGAISEEQAVRLRALWARPGTQGPSFGVTNVLYYFGGLVAIGAMSLFMTLAWSAFGSFGLLAIALGDIAALCWGAKALSERGLATPAGILATLAVFMVPLAAWCAQHALGWWPAGMEGASFSAYHKLVDWRWIGIELVTLAAAAFMLRALRLPFMVMPVALTLWYMSMDAARMLSGEHGWGWGEGAREASMFFGLATLLLALWVDLRVRASGEPRDFSFWLYVFGMLMFWCSLTMSHSDSEWSKLGYGALNMGFVFFGAAIGRRVVTVFGAIGVALYLGHLAHSVFGSSLAFSFVLMGFGLGVVALGVWWQRHERALGSRLASWLPGPLKALGRP